MNASDLVENWLKDQGFRLWGTERSVNESVG